MECPAIYELCPDGLGLGKYISEIVAVDTLIVPESIHWEPARRSRWFRTETEHFNSPARTRAIA
jgi:hypothetical protein